MFFNGTLQEGIATAIQNDKCVLCFVTDEGEESQTWENEFLADSTLSAAIEQKAVALRLKAGSDEAGYLAAIFPLPKTPTLVVIKQGDLKGYITAGTTKEDFMARSLAALGMSSPQKQAAASQAPAAATQSSSSSADPQQSSSSSSAGPPTPTAADEAASNMRNMYAERRARQEAKRLEDERKAKEARAARAAAVASDMSPEAVETRKHAERIKKQRQEAAEQRARVLRRIEDDKLERQARAGAPREAKLGDVAASLATVESSSMKPASGQAALQVRLFDGSSLRTRFHSTKSTLKGDVRKWIDESRTDGQEPYTFKLFLPPPQASRKIDETEEGKTLADLGLTPSATLVLTPVKEYAEAYGASRGGLFSLPFAAFGFIAGLLAWVWGLIAGVFSGLGSRETRAQAREERERVATEEQAARVREQRKGRFAQFANPDDRRGDQQLYNGNSLNFEPRPDDDKDAEKKE